SHSSSPQSPFPFSFPRTADA
ncbi:hypothetical protein Zm00014a_024115, partial [Zea mays]